MNWKKVSLSLATIICLTLVASCSPAEKAPSFRDSASTPPPSAAESPSPSEPTKADSRGIAGSYYSDITVGLEKFGLTDHSYTEAADEAKDYYAHSATATCHNSDLDASLDYSISIDNDSQIVGSTFGATWDMNESNDIFIAGAQAYLGFVATMPYDTADSAAAKQWVVDNIPLVADRDGVTTTDGGALSATTTIGDAKFELYGNTIASGEFALFFLDISKAE